MSEEERQEWCPPRRPRDLRECSVRVALVSLSSRCRVQLGGEVNLLVREAFSCSGGDANVSENP